MVNNTRGGSRAAVAAAGSRTRPGTRIREENDGKEYLSDVCFPALFSINLVEAFLQEKIR